MRTAARMHLLAFAVLGSAAVPSSATTVNFSYTGAAQFFVVPTGITSLSVSLYGAQGGGPNGGLGGASFADLAVVAGETLSIFVGGQGGFVPAGSAGTAAGGFNGGGSGRINGSGAGGGGATDIQRSGIKLLVAGGGGGGSSACGGGGGGFSGAAGCGGAAGGTQSAGGAGSSSGGLGLGGSASSGSFDGGGGGWYGGGAGNGGGGGSGMFAPYLTNVTLNSAFRAGDGYAQISYAVSVVPEPEGYALAFAALGVLGSASVLRRRVKK